TKKHLRRHLSAPAISSERRAPPDNPEKSLGPRFRSPKGSCHSPSWSAEESANQPQRTSSGQLRNLQLLSPTVRQATLVVGLVGAAGGVVVGGVSLPHQEDAIERVEGEAARVIVATARGAVAVDERAAVRSKLVHFRPVRAGVAGTIVERDRDIVVGKEVSPDAVAVGIEFIPRAVAERPVKTRQHSAAAVKLGDQEAGISRVGRRGIATGHDVSARTIDRDVQAGPQGTRTEE